MMKPGAMVVVGLVAAAGCALSPKAQAIHISKSDEVANCRFLTRIDAGEVPTTAASSLEVSSQKKGALEKAASKGATHVVWDERKAAERTLITAGAYRCSPGDEAGTASAATPASVKEVQIRAEPLQASPADNAVPASTSAAPSTAVPASATDAK